MRLQLTKRTDYAIRASLALALDDGDGAFLAAPRIAERMRIPPSFLPQVLGDLSRAGLVEAVSGSRGGYRLARRASDLPLLSLIEAVEGPARSVRCVLRDHECDGAHPCALHRTWATAQSAFIDVLAGTTLADLASAQHALDGARGPQGPEWTIR